MPLRLLYTHILSTLRPTFRQSLPKHIYYIRDTQVQHLTARHFHHFHPVRMSDSESDGFRIADDSGSEDFAPAAPKAKKAAPAKKAAASTSKVTKVRTYFAVF